MNPVSTFESSQPLNRNLAIVNLRGTSDIVVGDITDTAHPFTVQSFGPYSDVYLAGDLPRFASASEISYFSHGLAGNVEDFAYVRAPLSGSPKVVVAKPCLAAVGGSWSPDGTAFTYGSADQQGRVFLHIVTGGLDRVVASFSWDGRVYGPPSGPKYSIDGSYISWVGFGSFFPTHVWTSSGKLITESSTLVNPALWSGDSLYMNDARGIEKWSAGSISLFLPGVHWIAPASSPAGGEIVYTVRDSSGTGHVVLVDTTSGSQREIRKSRAYAQFLTATLVWYAEERPCAPTDPAGACGGTVKTLTTGKTFVYDVQTGAESASILQALFDVWPHGDVADAPLAA